MRTVISARTHTLASFTNMELVALSNCVNEFLNSSSVDDSDCETRLGIGIGALRTLQNELVSSIDAERAPSTEIFEAWRDGCSIQLKAVSVFGDPADLSAGEVKAKLGPLIEEAESI